MGVHILTVITVGYCKFVGQFRALVLCVQKRCGKDFALHHSPTGSIERARPFFINEHALIPRGDMVAQGDVVALRGCGGS
jgi:hypothetical protein